MHVDLAAADVVAAGQRDARLTAPGEQRTEHVERRPHASDELVRCFGPELAARVDADRRVGQQLDLGTDRTQELGHHFEVAHRRHVAQGGDARCEQRRGHLLGARVLRRARDRDLAVQRAVGAHSKRVMSVVGSCAVGSVGSGRFSTNAVIASRMSFDRRRDGLRFGLDHQSLLDRQEPAAATARFAPCTASGGCAAISCRERRRRPSRARRRRPVARTGRCGTPLPRRCAPRSRSSPWPSPHPRPAAAVACRRDRGGSRTCARAIPTSVPRAKTRMSHASASCRPAPSAYPRTAAIVGYRAVSSQLYDCCARRIPATVGSSWVSGSSLAEDVVGSAAREHARVDPGRERAAVADHDERANGRVVADLAAESPHLVPHGTGEAVQLLRAVESQPRDLAVFARLPSTPSRVSSSVFSCIGSRIGRRYPRSG